MSQEQSAAPAASSTGPKVLFDGMIHYGAQPFRQTITI